MKSATFSTLAEAIGQGFGEPELTADGYIVRKRVGNAIVTAHIPEPSDRSDVLRREPLISNVHAAGRGIRGIRIA